MPATSDNKTAAFNTSAAPAAPLVIPPEGKLIFEAAARNDVAPLAKLVVDNPDTAAFWKSKEDMTALMYAAREGAREAAWVLLHADKNNVDDRNPNGSTALMFAAFSGKAIVAELLIKAGADINHVNKNGHTALMSAAAHGFRNTVQLLLQYDADVRPKDGDGLAAIDYARENGYTEIVTMLETAAIKQEEDRKKTAEELAAAAAAAEVPGTKLKPSNDDNTEALRKLEKNLVRAKLT